MEILNSKILCIGGRQYINYHQDDPDVDDYRDMEETHQQVEHPGQSTNPSDAFRETVACPNALFRHVIGIRGQTIKRLQEQTGAQIKVPKGRNASGLLVEAKTQESLESAVNRIQLLLSEKRWKEPFRHFVSIPLTFECIKDGFEKFKAQVLQRCRDDRGVEDKLFLDQNKIHLTIGTLVLLDDSELNKAIEVMQQIQRSDIFKDGAGKHVHVNGIEYMNDDPHMVDVLYAKVQCIEKPGYLQKLSDYIVSKFVQAGFMKQEHEHVKLHATIMNTLKTAEKISPQEKGQKRGYKRETFDAKNVLSYFNDHEFGKFPLEEIHISQRFTTNRKGYYESSYVVKIH